MITGGRMQIEQMFLLGFDGCKLLPDHWLRQAICQDLGGVILFDRNVDGSVQNISSPEQLKALTAELQKLSQDTLLIAVDQEGGKVCRLKEKDGFSATCSAAALGRGEPAVSTFPAAAAMAAVLAEHGINFNLAPVVDLNLNPDNPIISRYERSFSSRVDEVVAHARAFVRAHHAHGVGCCLKHFPGHGSSRGDSHLGFVDIAGDWQEEELAPYRQLFAAGFDDAVMTAHLVHRGLEPDGLPATLSPKLITGVLKNELGFTGVTMTDDLQMRAIADHYSLQEAVQRAVLAGVDLLVIGNNLERSGNTLDQGVAAVKALLEQGRVATGQIAESIRKITRLKQKIGRGFRSALTRH
jgi:beta-N-acetylhexosaminidase